MLIYTDTDIINAHKNIFSVVSFLKLICLLTFTFMRFFYILFELFKHPSLYFYLCKNSGGNCDSQAMSWEITRWNVEVPGDVSYRWVTFPRNVAKVLQDRHALGERHHRNDMSSDTSTCHRVTYNDTAGKSSFYFHIGTLQMQIFVTPLTGNTLLFQIYLFELFCICSVSVIISEDRPHKKKNTRPSKTSRPCRGNPPDDVQKHPVMCRFGESRSPKRWRTFFKRAMVYMARVKNARHASGELDSPNWHITDCFCISWGKF